MSPSIHSIGTAVPSTIIGQDHIRDVFRSQPGLGRLAPRLIGAVFDGAHIDTRHTVIDELGAEQPGQPGQPDAAPVFYDRADGRILRPGTGARNDVYVERSPDLFVRAAEEALAGAPGITAADVTHVVTVSCTGFFAPGPDYLLVRRLGLAPSTRRLHIGFMGCYGAFPALRAARDTCLAEPDAVVLVVCAELCTLHLRSSDDPDAIIASSVFADGAAAAVVSSRPAAVGAPVLDLDVLETVLTPVGEDDMAWSIGDQGFDMVLSSYVPHIVEEHVDSALAPLLEAGGVAVDEIDGWAVHPGGRSILDRVESQVGLSEAQMAPSRRVLREYGNMSSATVLFILREHLEGRGGEGQDVEGRGGAGHAPAPPEARRVCAMAFGPGLTVESALLTRRVGG
ncbi:type III polyketide synthase [Frigoribacterium sp. CFBP 8766]|uniref:type III polyketide synthase n=1 Tax=Frigoribacterium sp. CFBP 8766 TaxID=2775273 RepID=UPI001781A50A|nr:3-oxoacyl-[acyl-carrier-protein] synthase III C-terminal domain-containing protein [Frigoribacterium sp. CFBP 8766]MBD8585096.1 type III polyketide synthase [Frigoribacterium sp. CFBP 8766]